MLYKELDKHLKGYDEITFDEIKDLDRKTNIRYLTYSIQKETVLFRFGGDLKTYNENYIVLFGKRCTFVFKNI